MICAALLTILGFRATEIVGVKEIEYIRRSGVCYELLIKRGTHWLGDETLWARVSPVDECLEAEGSTRIVKADL